MTNVAPFCQLIPILLKYDKKWPEMPNVLLTEDYSYNSYSRTTFLKVTNS